MMSEVTNKKKLLKLPVLPLKNMILLPRAVLSVKVARPMSINAVKEAINHHCGEIFITTQKSLDMDLVEKKNLNKIGVIARIFETVDEKDGSLKIFVEGLYRAESDDFEETTEEKSSWLETSFCKYLPQNSEDLSNSEAYLRSLKQAFKDFASLEGESFSPNILKIISQTTELESLIDTVAVNAELDEGEKLFILEEQDLMVRANRVLEFLTSEIEIAKSERNIRRRVQSQIEKHQKDYYLNEQVRAIYKELGKEDIVAECEKFKSQGKKLKLSPDAYEKLKTECKRLEQMQNSSPEAVVSRSYIESLLSLPWYKKSRDQVSLEKARDILDQSHAGMKKAKDTILDFVAAKKFAKDDLKSSPIICLVGAPGVGKTSLARSIATSLGREFVRISLGGMRDEAEIRGHRKTYIGAMPGKIISAMKKAKVVNPVILLDEIDKISTDFKGDPSSALLEALDPEQNKSFTDNFLETGYDLSQVIFVATANLSENIPHPLLDRMEMINISGYTEDEKLNIAETFLKPRLLSDHALDEDQVEFETEAIKSIINEYTREAGVRQLNRYLTKMIRKAIHKLLESKSKDFISINKENVREWLGCPKFKNSMYFEKESIGVVTGLAWTEVGGEILEVEIIKAKGKGGLTITGQLGEVMQESAQAALSYVRSNSKEMGIKSDFYSTLDLHLHMPEGATPKDGPSAGTAIAVALVSILTNTPVNKSIAMSGEISLQGKVLPVGGLKEKILAAERFGLKKVIIPKDNEEEVKEFSKDLNLKLQTVFVETVEEVLNEALTKSVFTTTTKKKRATKKTASVRGATLARKRSSTRARA